MYILHSISLKLQKYKPQIVKVLIVQVKLVLCFN